MREYTVAGVTYTREALVHKYLHLVKYVAGRIVSTLPKNVELDDLINDGILGLIDAIEKFEDSRGAKFETYAITRINGAIRDGLRSLDWVPRSVRQRVRDVDNISQALTAELGRTPRDEEIAERLGVSLDEFARIMQNVRGSAVISLEDPLAHDGESDTSLGETLTDEDHDVTSEIEERETRELLIAAVKELAPQERNVIERCYFQGQTLREIKGVLGLSESRVSQIHARGVIHLRQRLRELRAELHS